MSLATRELAPSAPTIASTSNDRFSPPTLPLLLS
uniref:Geranylgeranyl hydrogenase n=1 Tax=Arundo donax TaxID=35708 RepID=A0A0A9CT73_ARUDO